MFSRQNANEIPSRRCPDRWHWRVASDVDTQHRNHAAATLRPLLNGPLGRPMLAMCTQPGTNARGTRIRLARALL